MAGVANMAAAISPADRNLSVVIQFLHGYEKPKRFGFSTANGDAVECLNERFFTFVQHGASELVMRSRL
jgi:hypothetical protein